MRPFTKSAIANPAQPDATNDLADCRYSKLDLNSSQMSDILNYYAQLRDYIKHEDNLINLRLTWSLSIHAFLLTTYGLLFSKGADILVGASTPHATLTSGMKLTVSLLLAAQIIISVLGLAVGITSFLAIRAAHYAIVSLDKIAHHVTCCMQMYSVNKQKTR